MRNGAIAEKVGDVRFINFKTADNLLAGIEFSLSTESGDKRAGIYNSTVVGRSDGNGDWLLDANDPVGVITPRSENFTVSGVNYYRYDWNKTAAIATCSHCWHDQATDSGARTQTFSRQSFDTVTRKIRYTTPFKAIFYDLDGTLTGKGAKSWATKHYGSFNVPECEHKEEEYNGVVCDSSIQIRRVAFDHWKPDNLFFGAPMKVLPISESIVGSMTDEEYAAYIKNGSNYGTFLYKEK
jgi:hypothetical protein